MYANIRTEGALLPPDILRRIAAAEDMKGLTPEDYHIPGERINETITRSWNRLIGSWANFKAAREKLPESDVGTTATRERWLLPLFQELGYGRLQGAGKLEIEGKDYPVSHMWKHSPIHLVGFRIDLDRRTEKVAGASRMSPHSLVQEFLNRSDDHLWAYLSNGLKLRILRDNASLTRQAYVEFDLETMMESEAYPDFSLLWLLCHESRVDADKPEECWLEKWTRTAHEQGTRALDRLRSGVENAINALGSGFIAYNGNKALREHLRSGTLDTQDYYRQVLRLVYRLIFLFVAEDRELLLMPDTDTEVRKRYTDYYSTARIRRIAERRKGTPHVDLWKGLALVMDQLGSDAGCPELGLPALGSFLWSREAIPDLHGCDISNRDFLEAMRALAFTVEKNMRRPVDFRNLGAEELGSVYESLLELHPEINIDAGTFSLSTAGGSERKTTGSYYTPSSLIMCLLDSALNPVLEEACRKPDPEKAILNLKVCDPACGSGHFLVAAAHRIARRLAAVRTGDEEPAPEAMRHALRDVIGHCIYGVDINPMSVELCKVSLWMEALEPGKPLSFLDHRIQCGNSLLGTTPALIAKGIPDEAFTAIEGDSKELCSKYKKRNKKEREGQLTLFSTSSTMTDESETIAYESLQIDCLADDSIEGVRSKQTTYESLRKSKEYLHSRLIADAWCAAFVWKKSADLPDAVTEIIFQSIQQNPDALSSWMRDEVRRLADQYRFFHWHIAFPDVFFLPGKGAKPENEQTGWSGGFDVVLGNPPWDTLSPDVKEFFSTYEPQVRFQDKEGQQRIVESLLVDPGIREQWDIHCRALYSQVHLFKNSGRYVMFAPGNLGKGDFNVFRMFVETAFQIMRCGGRFSQVVPEGFYNGANCMAIRSAFFDECKLSVILGFENAREVWFPGVHTAAKFCIYSAEKGGNTESFRARFLIRTRDELDETLSGKMLFMPVVLIREFSPDALAIMELGSQMDIDIARKMYGLWPKFGDESAGPPSRLYMREIDMGNDRDLFSEDSQGLPLYEGRMVDIFDHRAKGYLSGRGRSAEWAELEFGDPRKSILPQWHIPVDRLPEKALERTIRYRIGFCDVGSPTNERSMLSTILPPGCISGHSVPTITFESANEWAYLIWLAVANSFSMDFIVRKKVSLHMTYTILDSLPFPRLSFDHPLVPVIVPLALKLTCTGQEMNGFWNAMASLGFVVPLEDNAQPPGLQDENSRSQARALLDAIVAHDLFGLTREEIDFILETFPIVKRKDIDKHGEYRTKRLILEAYDKMSEAMKTGIPYQTLLNPPPADPTVAHPPRSAHASSHAG
jgi:hypothetical protein